MAAYREALERVMAQLAEATLPDGTPTFAEVTLGPASRDVLPCAVVTLCDTATLCIRALAPLSGDAQESELATLSCAESACTALGLRGLRGSFSWTVEQGKMFRTWTLYYSVF